jgi:hypothetical protein
MFLELKYNAVNDSFVVCYKLINSAANAGADAALVANPGRVMPDAVLQNIANALGLA